MLHLTRHGDEVGRDDISEGEGIKEWKKGCSGKESRCNKREKNVFMKDEIDVIDLCDKIWTKGSEEKQ
jgi:hypothetical protein